MSIADPSTLQVRELRRDELPSAVGVLAGGMLDNPLHVAAFGANPDRRLRGLQRMFGALFRVMGAQRPLCAVDGDTIVGATGDAPPGTCRPTTGQRLRFLPSVVAAGPRATGRVGKWLAAWAEHDPDEPHSHLGPLAVDAHLQGRGIGSLIMAAYTRRLDREGILGYLETDKPENVPFYEKHGFVVIGESPVIGVPNWFMRREPPAQS
jgi:ribosomal protein S18 acetylase RimI-like enzyme